jgi:hypothetical protein
MAALVTLPFFAPCDPTPPSINIGLWTYKMWQLTVDQHRLIHHVSSQQGRFSDSLLGKFLIHLTVINVINLIN